MTMSISVTVSSPRFPPKVNEHGVNVHTPTRTFSASAADDANAAERQVAFDAAIAFLQSARNDLEVAEAARSAQEPRPA